MTVIRYPRGNIVMTLVEYLLRFLIHCMKPAILSARNHTLGCSAQPAAYKSPRVKIQ